MEKVQWNSIDKKQNGLKYSKNQIIHPSPTRNKKYQKSVGVPQPHQQETNSKQIEQTITNLL